MSPKMIIVDGALAVRTVPLTVMGRNFYCVCCGWRFARFTRGGLSMKSKASGYCPRCNSKPRHRWLWLNLPSAITQPDSGPCSVLHVAPAHSTHRALSKLENLTVTSAGLDRSRRYDLRMDLTRPALSERFDVVLCIHVLEHLDDDRAAMESLARLVKPSGLVLVGVPVRPEASTLEDPTVVDPSQRERLFGEPDHRRWYGSDIVDRLAAAGFEIKALISDEADAVTTQQHGLKGGEGLFLCSLKP